MTEVGFYHLTRTSAERALPKLLGRTLGRGERALVLCASPERADALDAALWLSGNPLWLPHGSARSGDADLQPIWLSARAEDACKAPNGAHFLFLIDGVSIADVAAFSRVFDLFDGRDPVAVEAARGRWNAAKAAGCTLSYWQEEPGGWAKKGMIEN